jgi:murein DD-endopeptidase MepM/ murein hydrolase activator NlpD
MNRKGFNTYKFGRFTINIFTNEVVIIYIGKEGTYIRNFYKKNLIRISRAIAMGMTVILVSSLMIAAFSSYEASATGNIKNNIIQLNDIEGNNVLLPDDDEQEKSISEVKDDIKDIIEDEKIKNELLLSDKTDYSDQKNSDEKLSIQTHKVKRGENLSIIATKYGISIDTICGSNNLRSYDFINEGAVLRIPNKDGILYNMKEGNNLINLAKKYKIPADKILAQNNFANPDFIKPGELVFIPDAKPQNIIQGFLWPVSSRRITSAYGWRRNPFNRAHREFHKGIDIAARYSWVKAARFGRITFAGWMGGYGRAIIIAHPGGYKTLYAHLSRVSVRNGQYVKQGQLIAQSGNTGRSTGPHLHFEIIKNGGHQNPRTLLAR